MQQLPNAPQTQNERYLAQRYTETFTGDAVDGQTTLQLSYPVQTTIDGVPLARIYLNGLRVNGGDASAGGYRLTHTRVTTLAGTGGITRSGSTATFTTSDPLPDGVVNAPNDSCTIKVTGTGETEYNITALNIHAVDSTHFTYAVAGSPTSPATLTPHYAVLSFYIPGNPVQVFKNGSLLDDAVAYTVTAAVFGGVTYYLFTITAGAPIATDVFIFFFQGAAGASNATLDGHTVRFDQPLTASDTVVVDYEYRT